MKRIPEPELMESDEQARAYSEADFTSPHSMFVDLFVERFGAGISGNVLDAGCGAADISVRFAETCRGCMIHGVDASAAMIRYGRERVALHGLEDRIELHHGYLPGASLPAGRYDALIVNSLLHHLPRPEIMWEIVRLHALRDRTVSVFIMDLIRPPSREKAGELVEQYCGDEAEILKKDFYNSLLAAYRPHEVREYLTRAGLGFLHVDVVSDRHFVIWGFME